MSRRLPPIIILFLGACASIPIGLSKQSSHLPSMPIPTASTSIIAIPSTTFTLLPDMCLNSDVRVEYGDSDVRDQSVTISILLTNTGPTPCLVQFFPHARIMDAVGKPLEIDYHFFKEQSGNSYLIVEPRQSVGFLIVWKNRCQPPAADGVKIQLTLSDAMLPIDIPATGTNLERNTIYAGAGCMRSGKESEVWISQYIYDVPMPLHP